MATPARSGGGFLTQYFLFILVGFGIVTLWMNCRHEGINPVQLFQNQHFSVDSFASKQQRQPPPPQNVPEPEFNPPPVEKKQVMKKSDAGKKEKLKVATGSKGKQDEAAMPLDARLESDDNNNKGHELAGLDCTAYGGPDNEKAAEMVYWSDIPSDNAHVSPFYDEEKFMTFEPDQGGWNNIRMSMESVLAMAVAMGRTLVLPPVQGMYLLDKEEHRHHVSDAVGWCADGIIGILRAADSHSCVLSVCIHRKKSNRSTFHSMTFIISNLLRMSTVDLISLPWISFWSKKQ